MSQTKPTATQLFVGVVLLVLTVVSGTQAWAFAQIVDNGSRVSAIEARGLVMDNWMEQRLGRFQVQLDRIEQKLDGLN